MEVNFFADFLTTSGLEMKSNGLREKHQITRMKMPWRDTKNKYDCGIYVMRHMETYRGGGLKTWRSGLKKSNDRQLKFLRAKYCAAIINADSNTLKDQHLKSANLFYRKSCTQGEIVVDPTKMRKLK